MSPDAPEAEAANPGGTARGELGQELVRETGGLQLRYVKASLGRILTGLSLVLAGLFLGILLYEVLRRGLPVLDLRFLTTNVKGFQPETGGVANAAVGSIYLMIVTFFASVPTGVAAAVYLEEFAEETRTRKALQRLIENLAGVPSIVFGLLGFSIFANTLGFDRSLVSGGLTLGLLVLPIVVVSTQEALSSVPEEFRDAARAMGATDWQIVKHHVLPSALPGILTGTILALSRAIGETAPILFLAATFVPGFPRGPFSSFLALPITIFKWAQLPNPTVQQMAWAAIIVLLAILLLMNSIAVAIRQWALSRRNW